LGIDMRPTPHGPAEFLKYEDPCALAKDESIPVAIEWSRCSVRVIVPFRCHCSHAAKRGHQTESYAGFYPASDRGFHLPQPDRIQSVAHCIRGAGASGGHDVAAPVDSIGHVYLARDHAHK